MIEDLYHIFEETKKKVKDRGVKLIDDAIAIRRVQGISADGWKTEYFFTPPVGESHHLPLHRWQSLRLLRR